MTSSSSGIEGSVALLFVSNNRQGVTAGKPTGEVSVAAARDTSVLAKLGKAVIHVLGFLAFVRISFTGDPFAFGTVSASPTAAATVAAAGAAAMAFPKSETSAAGPLVLGFAFMTSLAFARSRS